MTNTHSLRVLLYYFAIQVIAFTSVVEGTLFWLLLFFGSIVRKDYGISIYIRKSAKLTRKVMTSICFNLYCDERLWYTMDIRP